MLTRRLVLPLLATTVAVALGQDSRRGQSFRSTYINLRDALQGDAGPQIWAKLQGKLTPIMTLYVVDLESKRLMLAPKEGGRAEVRLTLNRKTEREVSIGDVIDFGDFVQMDAQRLSVSGSI